MQIQGAKSHRRIFLEDEVSEFKGPFNGLFYMEKYRNIENRRSSNEEMVIYF
jgi:hypothetical protein